MSLALLGFPLLFGLIVGRTWPDAGLEFYSTCSQIIGTLFIAIVIELFLPGGLVAQSIIHRRVIFALLVMSWAGLFACMLSLLDRGDGVLAGLSGGGLMAASIVVSLAIYARLRAFATPATSDDAPLWVVLVFLAPPMLLVIAESLLSSN